MTYANRLHICQARMKNNVGQRAPESDSGGQGEKSTDLSKTLHFMQFGKTHYHPRTTAPIEFIDSSHHHICANQAQHLA